MQIAEETIQKRVIKEAIQLFSTNGYCVLLEDIAAHAEVSIDIVKQYFQTKDDILDVIRKQQMQFVHEYIRLLNRDEGPYTPKIIQLFVDLSCNVSQNRLLMQSLLQSSLSNQKYRSSEQEMVEYIMEVLEDLFEKGQKSGEFTTIISSSVMAKVASQQYFGVLFSWCLHSIHDQLQEQVKIAFGMLFNGLLQRY